MPRTNPARRAVLADAAIRLLAREGAHGLTHRAVEREAGLPPGTAVNYFRSREEILIATAERVVSLSLDDMARIDREADTGSTADPLTELVAASLIEAVTRSRERYLAIFELQLEARRRPALARTLEGLQSTALSVTADEHAALGLRVPPDAVGALMTLYGGALFVLVTGPGEVPAEAAGQIAHAIVHGALGSHAAAGRAGTTTDQ